MMHSLTTPFGVALAALACAAVLSAAAPGQGGPVTLTAAQRARVLAEIRKDRAETQRWLKSDITSYLATVDRRDFEQRRTLTVGRAPDNDVRVDDASFSAHHLRVTVEGDQFRVEALDPSARFEVDKTSTRAALVKPSAIGVGRFQLRLSHQRYPAIIVCDPRSPHFADYKGLTYFPPNLSLRYELPLTPNPKPETVVIMSTRGNQRQAARVGWFEFRVDGEPVRLEAVRLLEPGADESDLGVLFRDATTGNETYPLGRYVDARKLANGRYLLDFNFAYNPACAFSDHYNCPIPQRENTLPVAIRAGEMDSHYH
ncbi:MAG TPA: DUF1684 domain-containing protein [Vicinamibacterales bacterium]|nr:DUF1684 domain-containing protein [Vicinamibacterales bacterium]